MKFRAKIVLLITSLLVSGILATTYLFIRTYSQEKEESILESNLFIAPSLASSIGSKLFQIQRLTEDWDQNKPLKFVFGIDHNVIGLARYAIPDGRFLNGLGSLKDQYPNSTGAFGSTLIEPNKYIFLHDNRLLLKFLYQNTICLVEIKPDFFKNLIGFVSAFEVYVVSNQGDIIFTNLHSESESLPNLEIQRVLSSGNKQAAVSKELKSKTGKQYLATIAPVAEGFENAIVVQAPKGQIQRLVQRSLESLLIIIAGFLLLAIFLGFIFSRKIISPLEQLTRATKELSSGNWDISLETTSRDEIGDLIRSFSKMGRDLKSREAQLKETQIELFRAEKLASLGKFSAGVAHEIKNPLTSILGFAQLSERKAESEIIKSNLQFIIKETYRATNIVQDLLTFARQKKPELSVQDLGSIIKEAIARVSQQYEQTGVKLDFPDESQKFMAKVDPEQIMRVLINLLVNALHAICDSDRSKLGRVVVRISQAATNEMISIEIEDNGSGITPENIEKIFEPFFSTKTDGKGTGLGLSICHGIIEQHSGQLSVSSELGVKTSFFINLPAI